MTTQTVSPREETRQVVERAARHVLALWSAGFVERKFDDKIDLDGVDLEAAMGKRDAMSFEDAVEQTCAEMEPEEFTALTGNFGFSPAEDKVNSAAYRGGMSMVISEPLRNWLQKHLQREYEDAERASGRNQSYYAAHNTGNNYTGSE